MLPIYPIRFEPIYRDYLWGGEKIAKQYERKKAPQRVAESWEISDRLDGMSVVANGALKGMSLRELVQSMGEDLLGINQPFSSFPLLMKILDAKETLSVQVHPNEKSAPLVQGEPKTEMWYVLEADAGAVIYSGFKPEIGKEEFLQAINSSQVPALLNSLSINSGDAIFVPGGCVHAIGSGSLIFEVQQNSNSTYRIYDWERKDSTGKARELHLEEAFATINWPSQALKQEKQKIQSTSEYSLSTVVSSPYFTVKSLEINGSWDLPARPDSFQSFFCLSGEAIIEVNGTRESFKDGMTYLVPAAFGLGKIFGQAKTLWITLKESEDPVYCR